MARGISADTPPPIESIVIPRTPAEREIYERQVRFERTVRLEIEVLGVFFESADAAGLTLPDDSQLIRRRLKGPTDLLEKTWPPPEIRGLLGLAQHYGLPTRLLDWTWSPRVAAYFAARDAVQAGSSSLAIWEMDAETLFSAAASSAFSEWYRDRTRPAPSPPAWEIEVVTAPGASNANLRAQRGLFTLLTVAEGSPFDVTTALEALPRSRPLVHKWVLDAGHADELLYLLQLEGVTAATLFPGLDGIVASLHERANLMCRRSAGPLVRREIRGVVRAIDLDRRSLRVSVGPGHSVTIHFDPEVSNNLELRDLIGRPVRAQVVGNGDVLRTKHLRLDG